MIVTSPSRGAFIVLEGVDRCGKTTQCALLLKHLLGLGLSAVAMRFPDRTTPTGTLINGYLQQSSDLDDRAVHLLFSANRWEAVPNLTHHLLHGTHVVCDRYAHSGVAFSSSKDTTMSVPWCMGPDTGLPAPDVVIFLALSQEETEKRGGYGEERYEKRDMQMRVRKKFDELRKIDQGTVVWHVIDAAQPIEQVQADIVLVVERILQDVCDGKPLAKLWDDGSFI